MTSFLEDQKHLLRNKTARSPHLRLDVEAREVNKFPPPVRDLHRNVLDGKQPSDLSHIIPVSSETPQQCDARSLWLSSVDRNRLLHSLSLSLSLAFTYAQSDGCQRGTLGNSYG